MIIESRSRRMNWVARVCRLLPPAVSERIWHRLYPPSLSRSQNEAFTTQCSLANIRFRFPRCEDHAVMFAIRGFFEWRNVVLANALCKPGDTIIDVGSNIGTETLIFARTVGPKGTVVAFEPWPENFSVLQDLVAMNDLHNLVLYQAAVSDTEGTVRFLPPKSKWNTGTARVAGQRSDGDRGVDIPSVVLDRLHAAGEFPLPRLMVMDVEGVELFVLRGAEQIIKKAKPYIILEVSLPLLENHKLTPRDMFDYLTRLRYKPWVISGRGLSAASPDCSRHCNWLCIPEGQSPDGLRTARRLSRHLRWAALLPPVRGLNPAVVNG